MERRFSLPWASVNSSNCQQEWRRLPFNLNRRRPLFLPPASLSGCLKGITCRPWQRQPVDSLKIQQALAGEPGCWRHQNETAQPLPPQRYQHDLRHLCLSRRDGPMTGPSLWYTWLQMTHSPHCSSTKNNLPLSAALLFLVSLHFPIFLRHLKGLLKKKMRWAIINKINAISCINNMSVCVCALIVCSDKHRICLAVV